MMVFCYALMVHKARTTNVGSGQSRFDVMLGGPYTASTLSFCFCVWWALVTCVACSLAYIGAIWVLQSCSGT